MLVEVETDETRMETVVVAVVVLVVLLVAIIGAHPARQGTTAMAVFDWKTPPPVGVAISVLVAGEVDRLLLANDDIADVDAELGADKMTICAPLERNILACWA